MVTFWGLQLVPLLLLCCLNSHSCEASLSSKPLSSERAVEAVAAFGVEQPQSRADPVWLEAPSGEQEQEHEQLAKGSRKINNYAPQLPEARRLYCDQCAQDCAPSGSQRGPAISPQDAAVGATDSPPEATAEAPQKQRRRTGLSVECQCRAVYDSAKNSVRCKSVGLAEAKLLDSAQARLASRALARSQSRSWRPSE